MQPVNCILRVPAGMLTPFCPRFLHNGPTVCVKGFTSVQQLPKDNPWRRVNSAPRLRALLANTESSHIARLPQRRRTHNARIDPQLQLRVKGSAKAFPLAGKTIFPFVSCDWIQFWDA